MNYLYGRYRYGQFRYASPGSITGSTPGYNPESGGYFQNQYAVYAYAPDGTKTAIFGSGMEENVLASLSFSITSTGCGDCTLTFNKLPSTAELNYMQRIDIHLFGDQYPWYSGYILSRPVDGTTEDTYTFKAHGYYNKLADQYLFETYQNIDPGDIVRDIAQKAEASEGLIFNDSKIMNAGYTLEKIVFDGVSIKDALQTLADFSIDYVFGVDEYRNLYFKPRNTDINEQARLTVGKHISGYVPTWDASKIVNWARIKGGNVNDEGEAWLATVEDKESQALYGLRQAVWTLPEAYSVEDAQRWGQSRLNQYSSPTRSAKVSGVQLDYPMPDGTFYVRKMSTDGNAEIRTLDGSTSEYPITKITYKITPEKGITADLQLGEPSFQLDRYLLEQERNAKAAEQANASAIKQLATEGGA